MIAVASVACVKPRAAPAVLKFEFAVWLVEKDRNRMFATDRELRAVLRARLPEVLSLDAWHQPTFYDELPSQTETYRMLADVLATRDAKRYRPKLNPDTHWKQQRG